MRAAISADWTGEPPGELMASATALAPRWPKARASRGATDSTDRPREPSRPPEAMTPDRRTTGTTAPRRKRLLIHSNMPDTVAARRLEGKPPGVAQDRLGFVGVAAVRPMQDERRRLAAVERLGAAGADQY